MTRGQATKTDCKVCVSCGRTFAWRKKWERQWEQVKYCSKRCRQQKVSAFDRKLEEAIVGLLRKREKEASICPSEAARQVGVDDGWRSLMEPARRAARRLVEKGVVQITQRGKVVDPSTARGPICIRLAR